MLAATLAGAAEQSLSWIKFGRRGAGRDDLYPDRDTGDPYRKLVRRARAAAPLRRAHPPRRSPDGRARLCLPDDSESGAGHGIERADTARMARRIMKRLAYLWNAGAGGVWGDTGHLVSHA